LAAKQINVPQAPEAKAQPMPMLAGMLLKPTQPVAAPINAPSRPANLSFPVIFHPKFFCIALDPPNAGSN